MPILITMSDLKSVDFQVLCSLHRDMGNDVFSVVDMFLDELDPSVDEICKNIMSEDNNDKSLTHSLRGLARSFGADKIGDICLRIEGSNNGYEDLLSELKLESSVVREIVLKWVGENNAS